LDTGDRGFEAFAAVDGERLRRALVSPYGVDAGCDAWAEALAWAREHWARVVEMGIRSATSSASALVALSPRERTVALLVHGYGYSYAEVAAVTGSTVASVRNELHRAMKRLRRKLDVT
jgi:DNA-directed RNA polymerase specialized sigma24 family protein